MIGENEKELILKTVEENAQKSIDKRIVECMLMNISEIKERGVREFLAFYSNTIGEPPITLTMATVAFIKRLRGEE